MNRRILTLATIFLGLLAVRAQALPREQVPADAKWVVYIDAHQLRHNPIAKALRQHHKSKGGKHGDHAQARRALGLASWDDLSDVVLYGTTYDQSDGILLVNARADRDAIARSVEGKPNYKQSKASGQTVHSWTYDVDRHGSKSQHTVHLALLPGRAVMSRDQAIAPALAVLEGKRRNLNSAKAMLAPDVPTGTSIYMEAVGTAAMAEMAGPRAQWLRNAERVRMALVHADNAVTLNVDIAVRDAEAAVQFKQVLEGFRAMMMLRQQGEGDADLSQAMQAINIDLRGNVVVMTWTMPNDRLGALLEKHGHRAHRMHRER